jgi:hypothetical protein
MFVQCLKTRCGARKSDAGAASRKVCAIAHIGAADFCLVPARWRTDCTSLFMYKIGFVGCTCPPDRHRRIESGPFATGGAALFMSMMRTGTRQNPASAHAARWCDVSAARSRTRRKPDHTLRMSCGDRRQRNGWDVQESSECLHEKQNGLPKEAVSRRSRPRVV